jgi:hypothetical protein
MRGRIELVVQSGRVGVVGLGKVNDHPLTCASEQHSIAIHSIFVFLGVFIRLPRLSVEVATAPFGSAPEKILALADANPVEFQSLNLELSGRNLKFGGGSHIVTILMIAV